MPDKLFGDAGFTSVQRALGDFLAGNPVIVEDGGTARLALSIEALTPDRLDHLRVIAGARLNLALSFITRNKDSS